MSFDLDDLRLAVARYGHVVRVLVASLEGSGPREVGASMLVWADAGCSGGRSGGQSGSIGGGALEHAAVLAARGGQSARQTGRWVERMALGPSLGQCCGGAVTLLYEAFDAGCLPEPADGVIARPLIDAPMPLAVRHLLAAARGAGVRPPPHLLQGWMIEPLSTPTRQLWLWGAGHVGRALASVLSPLPGVALTWIDTASDRFPDLPAETAARITQLTAANPADLAAYAPKDAEHLIVTYSHALDLDLCHRLLARGFRTCGLIGSATKWARFRSRLTALGHTEASVARIACPIGDPALGKHPQTIAIGVAAGFLHQAAVRASGQAAEERAG